MAANFEIEQSGHRSNNRITQGFPGFKFKSFTFMISLFQVFYYLISVFIDGQFINPTICALFSLGANVITI